MHAVDAVSLHSSYSRPIFPSRSNANLITPQIVLTVAWMILCSGSTVTTIFASSGRPREAGARRAAKNRMVRPHFASAPTRRPLRFKFLLLLPFVVKVLADRVSFTLGLYPLPAAHGSRTGRIRKRSHSECWILDSRPC